MLIRDLENKTGLDRATIRFYEKEGLIIPIRKDNGYREYTDDNFSHLLKIKLLRQLGMSLETIKGIQQGTADFNAALSERIEALERQIKNANKAKEVCAALRAANVSYDTMDALHYLELFSKEAPRKPTFAFREQVYRPYHPFRRLFARITDYALLQLLLELLIIVIFRVRPYGKFLSILVTYGTPFLAVIFSAIMLRYWGTTPGKWLFGLSVRSENGDLLSFDAAFHRESGALKYGYGFGIPIYTVVRRIISWVVYKREDLIWDRYCEYQYHSWTKRRKAAMAIAVIIIGASSVFVASDMIKPKYRGDVTIEQFAENYNYYYNLINGNDSEYYEELQADGTWMELPNNVVVVEAFAQTVNPRQNFVFETTNSCIDSIIYENEWIDVTRVSPINTNCQLAIVAAAMTQKGMGLWDIYQLSKLWEDTRFDADGKMNYKNIEIIWDVESENCVYYNNAFYCKSAQTSTDGSTADHSDARVSVALRINILDK